MWQTFLAKLDAILNAIVNGDYTPAPMPPNAPETPPQPIAPNIPPPVVTPPSEAPALLWDTPKHAYHATRVLCDNAGLTVTEKNLICACIYQESNFYNYKPDGTPTIHENLNKDGSLSSTDWGIVQVNDWFHIISYYDFPSVDYVMQNPDKCVMWMIRKYKAGQLNQWISYKSGAYRQWLLPNSPMWKLAK